MTKRPLNLSIWNWLIPTLALIWVFTGLTVGAVQAANAEPDMALDSVTADTAPFLSDTCATPEPRFPVFPSLTIPDGFGITVSPVTGGTPEEHLEIVELGFPYARSEVRWEIVEETQGTYDFSYYDDVLARFEAQNLKASFILMSHVPLDDPGHQRFTISTPEGRAQFVEFTRAAAAHFAGHPIVWEIWTEPDNDKFWPGGVASPEQYYELFEAAFAAMREADPNAIIVGPGITSDVKNGGDLPYLERLMELGYLEYVDGVSVHPYTAMAAPEVAVGYYRQIHEMIERYAPAGRDIPLLATEMGYENEVQDRDTTLISSRYVPRHFILGLWQEMPMQFYFALRAGVYSLLSDNLQPLGPGASYAAMVDTLDGFHVVDRLLMNDMDKHYAFLLSDCSQFALAFWLSESTRFDDQTAQTVPYTLPLPAGSGELVTMLGERQPVSWGNEGLTITLSEDPQYLLLSAFDPALWPLTEEAPSVVYEQMTLTPSPTLVPTPVVSVPTQRVNDGLIALYTFDEGDGNTVTDSAPVAAPTNLIIPDDANVTWTAGSLRLESPNVIASAGPATAITSAVMATGELTVELWIAPADITQNGPARIITLSSTSTERNFTIGQGLSSGEAAQIYTARVRSSTSDENGTPSLDSPNDGSMTTDMTHVVFTHSASGDAVMYINGARVASASLRGPVANWSQNFQLGLGNEFAADRPWLGEYALVALYNRALVENEVIGHYQLGPDSTP